MNFISYQLQWVPVSGSGPLYIPLLLEKCIALKPTISFPFHTDSTELCQTFSQVLHLCIMWTLVFWPELLQCSKGSSSLREAGSEEASERGGPPHLMDVSVPLERVHQGSIVGCDAWRAAVLRHLIIYTRELGKSRKVRRQNGNSGVK